MAMMAMTTSNSIKVNPARHFGVVFMLFRKSGGLLLLVFHHELKQYVGTQLENVRNGTVVAVEMARAVVSPPLWP